MIRVLFARAWRAASLAAFVCLAIVVAAPLWAGRADAAVSASCKALRDDITKMENRITSGAALTVSISLRALYAKDCLNGYPRPSDPWFKADGTPAADANSAGPGGYQAPQEIADYCRKSSDAYLCALMLELGEGASANVPDIAVDPADELPPFFLASGGDRISVPDECLLQLAARLGLVGRVARQTGVDCSALGDIPEALIAALKSGIRQFPITALTDSTRPTADPRTGYQPQDPGFLEMCNQAAVNETKCTQRHFGMSDIGKGGSSGQAGAFNDCSSVYAGVVAMCKRVGVRFAEIPDDGRAPQSPGPAVTDECRRDVVNYADAAQAHDSGKAVEAYRTLSQACPDLVARTLQRSGPPFPERQMGNLTRGVFGACLADPASCDAARNVDEPAGGGGVDWGQANDFLDAMIGVLGVAQGALGAAQAIQALRAPAVGGYGSNMNSLAAPIIRSRPGLGSPGTAPPTSHSTITGLP